MRKAAWRPECSDKCTAAQETALQSSIFILTEYGPTCFGIREDGNRLNLQVRIGDAHSCSCPDFKKTSSELCKHICWILLKKFRVPREDALSWQLGLTESEIDSLLQGYQLRNSRRQLPQVPTAKSSTNNSDVKPEDDGCVAQRKLEEDDICPVCQEDFFTKTRKPVTYCRYGCGNSVHMQCMKLWAEHQQNAENIRKLNKDEVISCPICRGKFCSASVLRLELMAARDYLGSRSNTLVAEKQPSSTTAQPSLNSSNLPNLISVQSLNLLRNGGTLWKAGELTTPVGSLAPWLAATQNTTNVVTASPEAAKEVRMNFKKPRPGLQCLQCLSWFKKGIIICQLPCHHFVHKGCIKESDLSCTVCHQAFALPRSMLSSAPVPSQKLLTSSNVRGQSTLVNSAMTQNFSQEKQYINDMVIGQVVQQPKATMRTRHSIPPKHRQTNHQLASDQNERIRPRSVLPATFCLTATQVIRLGP